MVNKSNAVFEYNGATYTCADIYNSLLEVGISRGDVVFAHSDLKSFGKVSAGVTRESFIEAFVSSLEKCVGAKGNLIMPAFSYSFCKNEIYDAVKTPSTVGIMTEYFRNKRGVARSSDPILSVSVEGKDKNFYIDVGFDCFGEKSIFEKLYERDAKIIFMGDTFDITYMHFVERRVGVPYRFNKTFKGIVKKKTGTEERAVIYYARDLDKNVEYDLEKIAAFLKEEGVLKCVRLGHSKIRCVGAIGAFNIIKKRLLNDVNSLLRGK